MEKHEIKAKLEDIKFRNATLIEARIKYYERKKDDMKVLDRKIELAIIQDLFTEIEMALGL